MIDDRLLEETESDDSDNSQNEEISINHIKFPAHIDSVSDWIQPSMEQLSGSRKDIDSSETSNESYLKRIAEMTSVMDRLTRENHVLRAQIGDDNIVASSSAGKRTLPHWNENPVDSSSNEDQCPISSSGYCDSTDSLSPVHGSHTPPWASKMKQQIQKIEKTQSEQKAAAIIQSQCTLLIVENLAKQQATAADQAFHIQKLEEGQSKINAIIQEVVESQGEIKSSLNDVKSDQSVITANHDEITSNIRDMISGQEVITANHLNSSFLVSSLESTTQDRDGLRATVRSQAGKMGVVTKKLGEKTRKVSELEAERGQTIERSDVMQELRMMEIRMMMEMNENSTRAEKRFAEHMGIQDQPLGNPSDNYPYSQWTDELRDEFSVKLKKNYEGAARLVKRKDLPPLEDFPDAAKSRLFQIGLGVVLSTPGNAFNLENSPSKHRYDLVKLSGSIFDVNTAAKIRASLDIQEKYWCNKLSKPYVENRKVYPLMEGDAFLSPDVSL